MKTTRSGNLSILLQIIAALICIYLTTVLYRESRSFPSGDFLTLHMDEEVHELLELKLVSNRARLMGYLRSNPNFWRYPQSYPHHFCERPSPVSETTDAQHVAVWREYRSSWLFKRVRAIFWNGESDLYSHAEFFEKHPEAHAGIPIFK
jgi:hypothetical protein